MADGDVSPHYIFYNGPEGNTSRFSFYGVTGTPTVKIDGLAAGSSPAGYATAIANRTAIPAIVSIDVNCVGDATGGTAYVSVTAEEEPTGGTVKVFSNILEDHEVPAAGWGGYNNKELMWIPVARPLGTNGQALEFTGPYPQTLTVEGTYILDPDEDIFDNLNVSAWVQYTTGTKEVLNASFDDLPDTSTGIAGEEYGTSTVSAWPNPSNGAFSIATQIPQGTSGTVEIFNVSGRMIHSFSAGSVTPVEMEESGVYFIRMTTSAGEIRNSQVAVIR